MTSSPLSNSVLETKRTILTPSDGMTDIDPPSGIQYRIELEGKLQTQSETVAIEFGQDLVHIKVYQLKVKDTVTWRLLDEMTMR